MNYDFNGKKTAVLGWGINGVDAANYLLRKGAIVTILDKNEDLDISNEDRKKFNIITGEKYLDYLEKYDFVFRAPAVYRFLPEIVSAEKKGAVITSAIKLFFDICPAKIIGVTGTKGKGTTSTLIFEMLKAAGEDVYLAGNIGIPVLELLPKLDRQSWVVLELSSFQLIDLTKSPHISVILNITSDHLDWHKDRKEYIESKINIVKHQSSNDFSVINSDYEDSKLFANFTKSKKLYFSRINETFGCYVNNNSIILDIDGQKSKIGDVGKLLLRGQHNWENITAAICAATLAGVKVDSIKKTVFSFSGLEHRLELIREVGGIKFYDDSFSTNPQTTIAAANSFNEPVTLILGGSDKGLNYEEMAKVLTKKHNIKNIILIGEIAKVIKESLEKSGFLNNLTELGKPRMDVLVKKCIELTPKGGVVILSPAAASFDMFENYKERGNLFKEAVNKI